MPKIATAINCISGRAQASVTTYLKNAHGVECVDMVTAPGVNKLLADGLDITITELINKGTGISVNGNGSRLIAIVGHHGCLGNPAAEAVQRTQTLRAVRIVESWKLDTRVIGLWVDEQGNVSEIG